jgi:DHA1 family bicyclomycin/chloramphenicol resistance-like MFS transporter
VQGLSAGGGMVIGRAIIRDLFPPAQAQRVM